MMNEFKHGELESATDNFSRSRLIGKGSHGSVYKGTLPNKKLVAIKKQVVKDNEIEERILSSIITNNHPCLVNLLGSSHDKTLLVTEYMPNGTLDEALHADDILTWPKRIHIALRIAKALAFLHQANIVHRDVKSTNVLFDENWDAKLADFGLALRLNDGHHLPAGTMGYIDPCYTKPRKLSAKVDVYSYGVLLLEIVSGRKAIDVLHSPASIVEWALPLIEERRFSEVCDKRVYLTRYMETEIEKMLTIAVRCVCSTQDLRPLMSQIVVDLEKIITAVDSFPFMMISFLRDIVVNTLRPSRRRRRLKSDANMASDKTIAGEGIIIG